MPAPMSQNSEAGYSLTSSEPAPISNTGETGPSRADRAFGRGCGWVQSISDGPRLQDLSAIVASWPLPRRASLAVA